VRSREIDIAGSAEAHVDCNPGERAVSGGVSYSSGAAGGGSKMTQSAPAQAGGLSVSANGDTPTGWALGFDGNGSSAPVTLFVVCASP
jgi:hypothetical protein